MKTIKVLLYFCYSSLILLHAESVTSLESLEIISSKEGLNAFDTSGSVETLSKQQLDIAHPQTIQQLSGTLSNTNISGIGSSMETTISMRGISNYVAYESSVNVNIDDIPIPFSYGFGAIDLSTIDRIEVKKGAQGTLYGKSSESGVMNLYTKSPPKTFASEVRIGAGAYHAFQAYADAGGRVNDDICLMVSAYRNRRDGFTTNTFNDQDFDSRQKQGLNLKLEYHPTDTLSLSMQYMKNDVDDGGTPYKVNTKKDPFESYEPYSDYLKMQTDQAALKLTYRQDTLTLTSITSHATQAIDKSDYVNLSGGVILDYDIHLHEIVQEIRVNYFSESAEWLLGGFYSNKYRFDYKDTNTLQTVPVMRQWDLSLPDEERALFAEVIYWLDSHWAFTFGLRYQQSKRDFMRDFTDFDGSKIQADTGSQWQYFLPKMALSYFSDTNWHAYLNYAKGYRSGGYNYRSSGTDPLPYEPQFTQSFEAGYKLDVADHFAFHGALFYNLIQNMRIVTFADDLSSTVKSADKAHSYGIECDVTYQIDPSFYMYVNAASVTGTYDEVSDNSNLESNAIIDIPDLTASIGAKYQPVPSWYAQWQGRYVGKRYYDASNERSEAGYGLLDVSVGYETPQLRMEFYVNNLLDTTYVDFMIPTPSNNFYHFGAPRIAGISFVKTF